MKKTALLLATLAVASVALSSPASAFTLYDPCPMGPMWCSPWDYSGSNNIKWETGSTVTYSLHESITGRTDAQAIGDLVADAFDAWWQTGIDLYFQYDSAVVSSFDDPDPQGDMYGGMPSPPDWSNGTVFYIVGDEANAFAVGWGVVGFTNLHMDKTSGELLDAPIYLNEYYFFSTSDATHDLLYDVLLHEIGHLLGLGHTNDSSTVMYPYVNDNTLSADDIAGVRYLYGLRGETAAVPEPASALLLGAGLIGLGLVQRRRRGASREPQPSRARASTGSVNSRSATLPRPVEARRPDSTLDRASARGTGSPRRGGRHRWLAHLRDSRSSAPP